MRVTLFLFILCCLLGAILWACLSGALLFLGLAVLLVFVIISIGYTDTAILFILGAREVRSADEAEFHAASAQEAYKLAVHRPRLYFYNGSLERAFVLQNKKSISLVMSKDLLDICSNDELAAICFELLLQVKKNLAAKRTKVMFVIGVASWTSHAMVDVLTKIIPKNEFAKAMNWLMFYLMHPWLDLFFKFSLGESYFKKLSNLINEYPYENDLLQKVGAKLRSNNEIYSLSSRKLVQFSSVNKSRHYQNIITLEFLPHEWDLIFISKMEARV